MARALSKSSGRMIPAEVTELIGRRHDLGEIRRMLSESRLVTLIGFGGVGKTRLALRMANQLGRSYADGVCFVSLGDLSDAALIVEATASALQLHDSTGRIGISELAAFLRRRELLLVLDNCEHMIDRCAGMAAELLGACSDLHILATSREPLRVAGESIWQVGPLNVPAPGTKEASVVQEYEAVRLLTERASHLVPNFQISTTNLPSLVEICRLLDGIPLALELAAVRLRALSADDLADQLRNRWATLDIGTRGAPKRHGAMTACLEWSHELCSYEERRLWSLLSVFAGGVEMPAIRYVVGRADPDLDDRVVDLVQSLVDKSILTVEARDGTTRYRMIEIIRQFGMAQLAKSHQLLDAQLCHRDWCAALLTECDAAWMGPLQIGAVGKLRSEEQNIREGLATCWRRPDQASIGLEMATRLRKYAYIAGNLTEIRGWLERFLAMAPDADLARLLGLRAAGWLAIVQGDITEGNQSILEASRIAEDLGPPSTWLVRQAEALQAMFLGDLEAAASLHEQALTGLRDNQFNRQRAETLVLLAMTYGQAGDLKRSAETLTQCLDLSHSVGESYYRSYALWFNGIVLAQRGDTTGALKMEQDALKVSQPLGDRLLSALCFEALAWCQATTSPDTAATLLGAADAAWDSMGTSPVVNPGLRPLHETCVAALGEALGAHYPEVRAAGRRLDARSALALALGEPDRRHPSHQAFDQEIPRATLTKREREVAGLVTLGMTNRDIAAKLTISPRTADTHVENILTKLGFTSRSQIAAWFASLPK